MAIRVTSKLAVILVSLFLWGCSGLFEDEAFSLQKTPYTGEEMRIDGYYWNYISGGDVYSIIIPYANGVVINNFAVCSLADFEDNVIGNTFKAKLKMDWGLFVVDSTKIIIENIEGVGGLHAVAYTYYGTILNDSTLHFYRRKESYYSVAEATDETFHFKAFNPKPDSINSFIP